uniref:Uncharacterized protein n=1 Tax=Rhizophora mucronata TaxID=61149 RepID=A0A2P2NVW4_RHIMU
MCCNFALSEFIKRSLGRDTKYNS